MEKRREFYKATAIFEVNGVSNKIDLGLRYGVIPENYSSTITDFDTFLKRAEGLGYKVKTEVSLFRNKQKSRTSGGIKLPIRISRVQGRPLSTRRRILLAPTVNSGKLSRTIKWCSFSKTANTPTDT